MGSELKPDKIGSSDKEDYKHRKKFTEGLLNIDEILKALNINKGQRLLDAGCGAGYMSKIFAKEAGSSGRVYALDTYRYFIKKLRGPISRL